MKTLTKNETALATMYICINGHITVAVDHVCFCTNCFASLEIVSDELPF